MRYVLRKAQQETAQVRTPFFTVVTNAHRFEGATAVRTA